MSRQERARRPDHQLFRPVDRIDLDGQALAVRMH
jgi:hypothetical protein